MTSQFLRPLLVTGVPRSGTTWLGRMISASKYYFYVHEFMNPVCLFQKTRPFQKFHYLDESNIHEYKSIIERLMNLTYKSEMDKNPVRRAAKEMIRNYSSLKKRALGYPQPLFKEPNACFSSDFLARRYGWKVLVLVRHPAAVVASFMRMGWPSDLDLILQQKALVRRYLPSLPSEKSQDRVEEISWLWRMIMDVLAGYMDKNRDWILVRHEDICRDPLKEYERIFKKLNIPFSKKMKAKVLVSTQSRTVIPESKDPFHFERNSQKLAGAWRGRLTGEEVERIRRIVEPISHQYYREQDWNPQE